jgi:hypothetical protein
MRSTIRIVCGWRLSLTHRPLIACVTLVIILGRLTLLPVLADGCFVFRWNKKVDINEPAQKAIIVHDAGREDLLLQVKYEGPPEDFGWLIPVPTLPTVEKGSMKPFYELSQLTQREWGGFDRAGTLSASSQGSREETVKVIEVKTVGAYEVAVLSARDAGSLARWLKAHDYAIPQEKAGIIDEYIRKGWYFIAAKIQLDQAVDFKMASSNGPTSPGAPAKARKTLQAQLSSGELHPLLISFDTPKCVFPLRISAVGSKPSEVSLYVLSAGGLLDKFIFDKALRMLSQRRVEWEQKAKRQEKSREQCAQNARSLMLASQMYSLMPPSEKGQRPPRDWSLEDIVAIGKEGQPFTSPEPLDDGPSNSSLELLQCLQVTPEKIPQSAKGMPRLKGKSWYLVKQVWTFRPEEMHDLEFQPALPVLAAALPGLEGGAAAGVLWHFGAGAVPILVSACRSTNSIERIHAASILQSLHDQRLVEPLLTLLKDEVPQVRFHAVMATTSNWDPRFVDPLISLFRDPRPQIHHQAVRWLKLHEPADRAPIYLELLNDPNPDVQWCALAVVSQINRSVIPRAALLRLLGSSRLETVSLALNLLRGDQSRNLPPGPWSQLLPPSVPEQTNPLSSAEAAPLMTNQFTMARLMGLKVLRENADAKAVELALPLLRDTNSIVRNRVFALLQTVSGQDIPQNDPTKWEQWWAANKATFKATKSAR